MKNKRFTIISIVVIIVTIIGGILWTTDTLSILPGITPTDTALTNGSQAISPDNLVEIQPASTIIRELRATGNIALVEEYPVELKTNGTVSQVAVKVGDTVTKGDLLVSLDTAALEQAVSRAEIELESMQLQLEKLIHPNNEGEVMVAQANLHSAQENLRTVQAGPTEQELAAAQSKLTSAQARYRELQSQPNEANIRQAKATLLKAEITLTQAQEAYNQIAWQNDVGMSAEASTLQNASIDYEAAKSAFDQANKPVSQSDLQSALSTIQTTQHELEQLKGKPSATDLAAAEATVADRAEQLRKLIAGASQVRIREAELNVKKAEIALAEAHTNLKNAHLVAPVNGTVLAVNIKAGQTGTTGKIVATIANISNLKLTTNVAEVDIPKVHLAQQVTIKIDAFRGQDFMGRVESIAPNSQTKEGVVNYVVTIHLNDLATDAVRTGMTAEATFQQPEQTNASQWLVPTNALQTQNGQTIVQVQGEAGLTNVGVIPGEIHGEWTLVSSVELQAGDQVIGSVTSSVGEDVF